MSYLEKVSLEITASSSKKWGTAKSTAHFNGYIAGVYYTTDAANPLNSSSSSIVILKSCTTGGNVLLRSSSGFDPGAAQWLMPFKKVTESTKIGSPSSWMNGRIPIANERLVLSRVAKSSAANKGSTEGLKFTVYIDGVKY